MDAVVEECERRAQRYGKQAVDAVLQLQYMVVRLDGMLCALRPALADVEVDPLDRDRVVRAHTVVRDVNAVATQMSEAISHVGALSEFGRLQQVAYEQRRQDLRVLAEARDIAESQMTSGGLIV
ncbi:MAG: hypothetical protein H7099_17485 [Gemmatimonadaceae bacterium]|nr:hypothetical protein [Gemmatimonadaceae bacterium]